MVPYNKQMRLPMIRAYRNALTTAKAIALNACLTDERNQNLMAVQKLLLCYHFKLGHTGFALVQWLGRNGHLGTKGKHMASTNCENIKCGTCNLGKQQRTANPAKHVENRLQGELKKDVLQLGQVIFSDQYQINVPSKLTQHKDGQQQCNLTEEAQSSAMP